MSTFKNTESDHDEDYDDDEEFDEVEDIDAIDEPFDGDATDTHKDDDDTDYNISEYATQTKQSILVEQLVGDARVTRNILTKYEMVRILGERIKQLTMGAKPMVKDYVGLSYDIIAEEELKLGVIPFKLKRPLPNGKYEIWELNELNMDHLLSLLE
jgi:DNA-directed RNA polymerase subunit K/omega